jgi:hypothetical protein
VVEGVLRIGVGAVLREVVGFVVLELVCRRLEKEGYCVLVAPPHKLVLKDSIAYWADSRLA